MDRDRSEVRYTINPETGRRIKVGNPTWRQLTRTHYTAPDGTILDQVIPDTSVYTPEQPKPPRRGRRVVRDPKYKRYRTLYVGSDEWNKRFLEYEWNGREFGEKRKYRLPKFLDTVEKRREVQFGHRNLYRIFDRKVREGRLSDVIDSSLGYALTYYHTLNGDMYKEWMNVKRTNKDFRIQKDNEEGKVWVRLPDGKSEEEVEPLNVLLHKKHKDEFKGVAMKHIMSGMRDYPQCFVTIMAYNLMVTHDGELKILNLTDDRLGHLRIVHRNRLSEWLDDYLKWYNNAVEEQETEGSGFTYMGWIGFHIEMFPLRTYIGHKHPTPSILALSVANPKIDDNRCLQRSLILASEGGHQIIAK